MARRTNKVLLWSGIIGGVLLMALALVVLLNVTGVSETWEFETAYGTLVVKTLNPILAFFSFSEQAAYIDNTEITLGEEVCWTEMTNVDWMDGCVERIEWEIQRSGTTVKTIGKDLSKPKCSGQLTYSECWKPTKTGSYQIVTYYILDTGDVSAESASESYFVVEDEPEPECDSHDYKACDDDNLYWYDSCGAQEEKAQTCEYGCVNNKCDDAPSVCDEGDEKCSGFSTEVCSNNAWDTVGVQKGKCGVTCIDNADCSLNFVCNSNYACESSGGCGAGLIKCSDGTCKESCDSPSPWPTIIFFLVIGIVVIGLIIFVVWRIRSR